MYHQLGKVCQETLWASGLNDYKALVVLKCSAVF